MLIVRMFECATAVIAVSLMSVAASAQPTSVARANAVDAGRSTGAVTKFDRVPPEMAFKAVEAAYKDAGIVPTMSEPALYTVGFAKSPAGPKIGGLKIQDAFNCGGDKKSPIAATTPLEVNIQTMVEAFGSGSQVRTVATAVAIPADGSAPALCKSTGRLERKLEPKIKIAFVARPMVRR